MVERRLKYDINGLIPKELMLQIPYKHVYEALSKETEDGEDEGEGGGVGDEERHQHREDGTREGEGCSRGGADTRVEGGVEVGTGGDAEHEAGEDEATWERVGFWFEGEEGGNPDGYPCEHAAFEACLMANTQGTYRWRTHARVHGNQHRR